MSDVFREVDEEVRRDQATEFWKKHGGKFFAVAVVIVAAVGGWRYYEHRTFQQNAALGGTFELAVTEANAGKPEAVKALESLAEQKSGTYPALAKFRLATELARAAKDDAGLANAVSAFDALGKDNSLPADWREVAQLRAAFLLVDKGPFEEVEKRLSPLATGTNQFRHSAREGIALAAFSAGKFDKALDALQAIILDAEAPQTMRQRAELLLAVVRSGPVGGKP